MFKALTFAAALAIAAPAFAANYLVDTGTPTTGYSGAAGLMWDQWLAGEVTFDDTVTISSISTYGFNFNQDVPLTISLYDQSGSQFGQTFPAGSAVKSTTITVPFLSSQGDGDWFGASGLNWKLGAGTYWFAFETAPGGAYGALAQGVPDPLAHYAFTGDFGNGSAWHPDPTESFALRIEGTTGSVPEPASWAMMLAGFGLVGGAMRTRSRRVVAA